MQLSREAQALANAAVAEEVAVSREEKDALYQLILQRKGAPHLQVAVGLPQAQNRRRIRPAALLVACVGLLALAGAGYATSAYFERSYRRVEMPAEYVAEAPSPPVEPAAGELPERELEGLGRLYLGALLRDGQPGERSAVRLRSGDQTAVANVLKGDGLGLVSSVSDGGYPGMDSVVNERNQSVQAVLDRMIADGKCMVTVGHADFHPIDYQDTANTKSLHYADGDGTVVGVTFDPPGLGVGEMPAEIYDSAQPEDLTINGNRFLLMQVGERYLADLVLDDGPDAVSGKVSISFGSAGKNRQKVLEILNTVRVHNPEANRRIVADRGFFEKSSLSGLREYAGEIADGIRSASDWKWERDGIALESRMAGWEILVTSREEFAEPSGLYPYGGRHTALVEQQWFDRARFGELAVTYRGARAVAATYRSADGAYQLVSTVPDHGGIRSPLDAIIAEAGAGSRYLEARKVIRADAEDALVLLADPDGNAVVYGSRKIGEGRYLVQELSLPVSELPADLRSAV